MHLYKHIVISFLFLNNLISNAPGLLANPRNVADAADTSGYDLKYILLDIEANDTNTYVTGSVRYLAQVTAASLHSFQLELADNLTVDSIWLEHTRFPGTHAEGLLTIPLSPAYPQGSFINIAIWYHGTGEGGGFFSGISSNMDKSWNIPVTWTLSEPYSAQEWFPSKQVLTDKIDSAEIWITTAPNLKAGSNGILAAIRNMPDGRIRYEWKSRYPIDFYLISIAVSDYQDYSIYAHPSGTDSILIQNYIYNLPGVLDFYKNELDASKGMIELYSKLLGPYPFAREKYGHCLAPIGGGMEHQTMTTLSDFSFDLVSHEMSHMWFGDQVTCGTWQDIWINEGFASYCEYLAYQYLDSQESADAWMQQSQYQARKAKTGSIYVPADELKDEWRVFSSNLSYKKGAAIIHMLRYELQNDSLFFHILQKFLHDYAGKTATGDDFKNVVESLAGKDYDWFFNQWYYGEGYPVFNILWMQSDNNVSFTIEQTGTAPVTTCFSTSMDIRFNYTNGGDTLIRLWIDKNKKLYDIKLSSQISSVEADPDNWLLKEASVDELYSGDSSFTLYPNPFSDRFTIQFNEDATDRTFTVSDMDGRTINQFSSKKNLVEVGSENMAKGVYLLTIEGGNKRYQKKIIKQ